MREKIYVSGKMTGDGNYRRKFLQAENRLFDAGYYPVNPAAFVPKYISWQGAMRLVLKVMLDCDGVALLPDWKKSVGAKIEARLAREIGIPVKPIAGWLEEAGE